MIRLKTCVLVAFLVTTSLPARANGRTVISVTGDMPIGWMVVFIGQGYGISWTQTNQFTNVSVSVGLSSFGVLNQMGRAYLTSRLGPGTTTNDEIASTSFTFPTEATDYVLFTGLTLGPGTYYLSLIGSGSSGSGWFLGCNASLTTADGVTLGPDYSFQELPYLPASGVLPAEPTFTRFSVSSATNDVSPGPGRVHPPMWTRDMNNAPTAQDQSITVIAGTAQSILLQASDADGEALGLSFAAGPAHGSMSMRGIGVLNPQHCYPLREFTYTPEPDFVGTDVIDFFASDVFESASSRITIRVVPSLSISRGPAGVRIEWLAAASEYRLESAASPASSDWQPVNAAPSLEADRLAIELSPTGDQKFFRLRR